MRAEFNPQTNDFWHNYFAQSGAGMAAFEGNRFQRGNGLGSMFKGLLRFIIPIAKSAGRTLGPQALKTSALIANDVAGGVSLKDAAVERTADAIAKLAKKKSRTSRKQRGSGLGSRRRTNTINRTGKRKTKGRKKKTDALGIFYS